MKKASIFGHNSYFEMKAIPDFPYMDGTYIVISNEK